MIVEDICAQQAHPPFPASVKDGYAVVCKTNNDNNYYYLNSGPEII